MSQPHSFNIDSSFFGGRRTLLATKNFEKIEILRKFKFDQESSSEAFLQSEAHSERYKSSPLQVSGAVTRLTVYRAAPYNRPFREIVGPRSSPDYHGYLADFWIL